MEVTQAHYTKLQNLLQEENPDRGSPGYDGISHNVGRIKLHVLGSTFSAEGSQPRHPDNNGGRAGDDEDPGASNEGPGASNEDDPEASNEDGSEMDEDNPEASNEDGSEINEDDLEASNEDVSDINSFFPFTLRFLDLSTLDLKAVPRRLPLPLFLRKEYDDISELIEKTPKESSVIISGQPGTGEVLVSCLTGSNLLADIKARPRISTLWPSGL